MDFTISLQFASSDRAKIADLAYKEAEAGRPFALRMTRRTTFFNPVNFTSIDLPSKAIFQFVNLNAMMIEVSGLCFVAKEILLPVKQIEQKEILIKGNLTILLPN